MDIIQKFIKDPQAVKVVSTLTTIALAVHFFFVGILEENLIYEILSLDSSGLYRLWNILIGAGLLLVGYASYTQNKDLVDQSLSKARARVAEGASQLSEEVKDMTDSDEGDAMPKSAPAASQKPKTTKNSPAKKKAAAKK